VIVNGVEIEDTFAEAFGMAATRLVITADAPTSATGTRSASAWASGAIGACR
jgi:formylmethanofuran--tetrahydromethanopterin N-formyltransferase